MKYFFLIVFVIAAVVGISKYGNVLYARLPDSITSKLPIKSVDTTSPAPDTVVLGATTDEKPKIPAVLTQALSVGNAAVGQIASIVITKPNSDKEVIDVSKVVAGVADNASNIPGKIAEQAKIEYCKQVLIQATMSAQPQ